MKRRALRLALTLVLSGIGVCAPVDAQARTVTVKDGPSLATALQQARADPSIRHIQLAGASSSSNTFST